MGDESFMGSVLDEKLDNYESVSGNSIANVEDDKTPVVGMKFKSYEEALDFYRQYARLMGFSARLKRTNYNKFGQYQSVEFICSRGGKGRTDDPSYLCRPTAKTNCPATILFKLRADGLLHVKKAILEHNHPMDPLKVELKKRRKKLPYSSPRHDENNGKIPIRRLKRFQSPSLKLVEDVSFGDKNLRNSGERGHLMLHDGDASAIYQFFTHMQKRFANFFYSMDLDEEGRLRNVFWADAVSRATYRFFGDVVLLDTSYLTCKFDIPLVLFLGVNNHGQLVLLGCGLVSDETFETYFWLFKAWLACMSRQPDSFISDQCVTIKEAMAKAFPGVHHRLCLWQVMKRFPMHFREQENCTSIKKTLEKIVHDSYTTDELEKDWKRMIEDFGLEANEWLNWLYENRHSWIPSYLKGTFWAGLTCSERNTCLSSFFDGFVYPETSLKQFLSIYEVALQSKYEKETQAELESFNKNPNLVSKFYMERQLVDLYTYNKFKQFQDELKATIYCNVSFISEDGPTSTYGIKESLLLEDSNPTDYRDFKVIYKAHELEVQCCCGSFQTSGILCRHALSVLKLHQIYEIPSHYIIDRWKKYIRILHPVSCPSDELVGNNRWERYDNLARCCLQLLDNGVVSSDKYHLSLKLLKEVEKFLSNDNNLGNIDVKIVPTETRTINDTEEVQVATYRAGNVQILSQMKRKGRPPKRKDDQETLLSRDHSGMNLSFPSASNAGADIDVQESLTALAEVSPSDFSLGCHYEPQLNHTHQSNDQSRIPLGGMFQGQFDHQAVERQPRAQWIYQQMLQETQTPNAPGWTG